MRCNAPLTEALGEVPLMPLRSIAIGRRTIDLQRLCRGKGKTQSLGTRDACSNSTSRPCSPCCLQHDSMDLHERTMSSREHPSERANTPERSLLTARLLLVGQNVYCPSSVAYAYIISSSYIV